MGLIPCASTSIQLMDDLIDRIRLMDDRLMLDVFTGQPIDAAGYEALGQFLHKWQSEGCPLTGEHVMDCGRDIYLITYEGDE